MTPYLDNKIADESESLSRLDMLSRAIKAIQDERVPAMLDAAEKRNADLQAFDATHPGAHDHPDRLAIIEKFEQTVIPLALEANRLCAPLERLIEFYTGRDVDPDDGITQH